METRDIRGILLDIGGVILSKGWDRASRRHAAQQFGYDYDEVEERHQIVFTTFEMAGLTLDDYLDQVVFYTERSFTREDYRSFMFAQSEPYTEMLALICELKSKYGLRTVAVSNESRELTIYRARKFDLTSCVDFFVCSCFVHRRKPDPLIYQMAMDQLLIPVENVVYVDDTKLLVEVARELGIPSIHHTDRESTAKALAERGLV